MGDGEEATILMTVFLHRDQECDGREVTLIVVDLRGNSWAMERSGMAQREATTITAFLRLIHSDVSALFGTSARGQ